MYSEKIKVMAYEINQIQNEKIRDIVVRTLEVAPDYFWTIPASSTGKYHPKFTICEGGLVLHSKAAVRIALELFRNNTVQTFSQEEKDLIVAALILHDTCKNSFFGSKWTVTEHPLLVKQLFEKIVFDATDTKYISKINSLIETHMGEFCKDRSGNEVLPKPANKMQRFVHMADFLASRKGMEINLNEMG